MDFGKLISRAWDILWKNAFLILLGVLAVLGQGGSSSAGQSRFIFERGDMPWDNLGSIDFGGAWPNWDISGFAIGGIVLLVIAFALFFLVLWALGLVARGGMISAVDDLERGTETNFVSAFQAGWGKGWRLLGIGLVPAIPGLILVAITISTFAITGSVVVTEMEYGLNGVRAFTPLLILICLFVPIMLLVSALQTFANRACMLEDTGVIASYRRGLGVLGSNLGPAVVLFILQVVINIVLGIVFFIPGILVGMCCLLWPLLILIQGAFAAFYSTLWTLAWREWVGGDLAAA